MRSTKQRAQAEQFKTTLAITSPGTAPTSSWWTEPRTREEFDARVQVEQARMREASGGTYKGVKV